ncbi:myelin-oligodendrocyte glycoprotein isoform X1 [Macaca nemestrina]|uniref:myelin-oligodendrocyte glycoprotein isoform X1 n=1 Tax=Macaca nemestrina TaxID=9545 RepID=UPI0039B94690
MASLSRPSLPSCLCSFLLLLLLQVSSSYAGQFRVIGPRQPIRALVGDEVELPCRISPGKNATGMEVGWYRPPFSRVVHLYRNGRDQDGEQAPEYRGRTELLKDAIGEGKVTLRIRNVRFSDEGGFTCFFRDHSYQEEAAIELKVEDPFYWVSPAVLVLLAVLPVLLLQITVGLVFLCLQYRLRGKLRAEIENLHRTFAKFCSCRPGWSAMARSRRSETSASWVQAILSLPSSWDYRSPLSEGALLEDNPVCNCAGSWTPGCLDHLLQLATSKTSRAIP